MFIFNASSGYDWVQNNEVFLTGATYSRNFRKVRILLIRPQGDWVQVGFLKSDVRNESKWRKRLNMKMKYFFVKNKVQILGFIYGRRRESIFIKSRFIKKSSGAAALKEHDLGRRRDRCGWITPRRTLQIRIKRARAWALVTVRINFNQSDLLIFSVLINLRIIYAYIFC